MSQSSNNTPIPMEKFAAPARRALTGANLTTLESVASVTESEVKALHGIGKNALKTLREILSENNMTFANEANDEQAIRELVATWFTASQTGDIETVLSLMSEDVIFMTVGNEPFGKEAFNSASQNMSDMKIEGTHDIKEIKVLGDWAYLRNYIEITMTRSNDAPVRRAGYTLTILQKNADGQWQLVRDANLLSTIT